MENQQKRGLFWRVSLLAVLVLSASILSGCSNKIVNNVIDKAAEIKDKIAGSGDTQWTYEKTIAAPIDVTSGKTETSLGDLEKDKVAVKIDGGAFDSDTKVELKTPDTVPEYVGKEIKILGAPIEITANGESARLNEKATINFKFDKALLNGDNSTSTLRVAYYNGTKWDYIKPLAIDMENGVMTFETYHFSLLGATKIQDETVLTENWIHSKTLDKSMRDNINKVTDEIANKIIDKGLEKMGISDKSIKGKILGDLLKENDYKDVYDAYKKGDILDMNSKMAVLIGKKIAENVPASTIQAGLKDLTADSSDFGSRVKDVEAVSQAAANIAEGQYKDAAKIIANQILDKTTIGLAGKVAVEVVNGQIESWKNSEVEAAYEAYNHGSSKVFYGYYNDKGDFNTVWDQMRGIRRQLEIEAIKKENEGRADAGLPPLNEKQMDVIRDGVKSSYQRQFEKRSANEEVMKAEEDKLRMLTEAFKKNNMFDSTLGPIGLDKGFDFETKLDVLYHFAEKMMNDTKRWELSDKNGLIMDDKISVDDIAQGAKLWLSGPEGRKQYAKFLKDRFNISLSPALKDLAGNWPVGTLTFKDVILPPEMIAQIEAAKNKPKTESSNPLDGGCDFSIDPRLFKGKTAPLTAEIKATSENGGTILLKFKDGKIDPMSFTYSEGEIKGSMSKDGATGVLSLVASDEDKNYVASGSFNVSFGTNGAGKMLIDINMSKPKQVAPAPTPKATDVKK